VSSNLIPSASTPAFLPIFDAVLAGPLSEPDFPICYVEVVVGPPPHELGRIALEVGVAKLVGVIRARVDSYRSASRSCAVSGRHRFISMSPGLLLAIPSAVDRGSPA
jgi:hypothetical protein